MKPLSNLTKPKSAQATIFIIIAIALVSIIALIFYVTNSNRDETKSREDFASSGINPSIKNIEEFIIDCLKETATEGIELIGIQGGYHKNPEPSYDLQWAFIPYYYHKGQFLNPTQIEIENQLSSYIDEALSFCLNKINFETFKLTNSEPKTTTIIKDNQVEINTDLTTQIENNNKITTFKLKEHTVEIESKLKDILEVSDYITESHKENKDFICINCLTQITKEKDLFVDFIAFKEDSTLIMIIENSTSQDPYIFQFLNKYELTL